MTQVFRGPVGIQGPPLLALHGISVEEHESLLRDKARLDFLQASLDKMTEAGRWVGGRWVVGPANPAGLSVVAIPGRPQRVEMDAADSAPRKTVRESIDEFMREGVQG